MTEFKIGDKLMFLGDENLPKPVAEVIGRWGYLTRGSDSPIGSTIYAIKFHDDGTEFLNDQKHMDFTYEIWVPSPKKHWKANLGSTISGVPVFTYRADAFTEEEFVRELEKKYPWDVKEDFGY